MNAQQPLPALFEQALSGRLMIKASAGTGKTWTICSLIVRLIVEKDRKINQMLVVTFTRPATAEMRHKIYERLLDSIRLLSIPQCDDPFIKALIAQLATQEIGIDTALHRLHQAVLEFDQLFISTIHGFCKKLLSDFAFSARRPFVLNIEEDTATVIHRMAADFWRKHLLTLGHLNVAENMFYRRFIADMPSLLPDHLTKLFTQHLAKPYLKIDTPNQPDWETVTEPYIALFRTCADTWQSRRDEITSQLYSAFEGKTHSNGYRKKTITTLASDIDGLFSNPVPSFVLCANIERLGKRYTQTKLRKDQTLPSDEWLDQFDRLIDAQQLLETAYQDRLQSFLYDFFCFAREAILANQRYQQSLTQDDLLMLAQSALIAHDGFAEKTHQQYPVMIIDENQDTDPTQAIIFNGLYQVRTPHPDAFFVTVGDPKQAIYRFRGGDIYTYLQTNQQAKENGGKEYPLSINYRSEKTMVDAINAFFDSPNAFMNDEMTFIPSSAKMADTHWMSNNRAIKGLNAIVLTKDRLEKNMTKEEAGRHCCNYVARRIACFLSLGKNRQLLLAEPDKTEDQYEALQGKHIAILTRNNDQASQMQVALARYQIAASVKTREHIFESEEAIAIFYLLSAIRQPDKQSVTLALSTLLFGFSGNDLFDRMQDDQYLINALDQFQQYQQYWHKEGIAVALTRCFSDHRCYQALMRYPTAERHLTNVRHLIEYLQKLQNITENLESLYQHVSRLLSDDQFVKEHDDTELRLESEDNLVQIMTIHKAKGLEFDWVFCPFLWAANAQKTPPAYTPVFYHDDSHQARLKLNNQDRQGACIKQQQDNDAEEIRIAYVALTRAKYYAEITTGAFSTMVNSPLGWLIHRQRGAHRSVMTQEEIITDWQQLAGKSQGAICVTTVSADDPEYGIPPPQTTTINQHRVGVIANDLQDVSLLLPVGKKAYDFSRLNAYQHQSAQAIDNTYTLPDTIDSVFQIPEGKNLGNLVHKLLEQSLFSLPQKEDIMVLCEQYRIDSMHADAISEMIRRVLTTPIDQRDFILGNIAGRQKIAEMHFRFPVGNFNKEASLDSNVLIRLARQYQKPISIMADTLYGYMNGIIDLLVEYQGKYYLIDYKTHHLGNQIDHYHPDKLKEIMDQQGYHLQYLLYLVAMRRWLTLQLPDYNDHRHLGGVYYLFTRGLSADHPGYGIFFDKPDIEMIVAIDDYFKNQTNDHDDR